MNESHKAIVQLVRVLSLQLAIHCLLMLDLRLSLSKPNICRGAVRVLKLVELRSHLKALLKYRQVRFAHVEALLVFFGYLRLEVAHSLHLTVSIGWDSVRVIINEVMALLFGFEGAGLPRTTLDSR